MTRRASMHLEKYRLPLHRRGPARIGALLALCASPLLVAAWFIVAPIPEPEPAPPLQRRSPPSLAPLTRAAPDGEAIRAIVAGNLLSPERREWPDPAVVDAGEEAAVDNSAQAAARRLEEARKQLETIRLVAVYRLRDDWVAMFDQNARAPHQDLLSLRVGDSHKEWTIREIDRAGVTMGFENASERIVLAPRDPAKRPLPAPKQGRLSVEVRPITGVTVEPPLSRQEAARRLRGAVAPEDQRVRDLAEELIRELEQEAGESRDTGEDDSAAGA